MAGIVRLAQSWLLRAMRYPDPVLDVVAWVLMEARLVAGTKGHPRHPWTTIVGWTLVMMPIEDVGLNHQECQEGGQFGGRSVPRNLEEQPGMKLDFLLGK